MYNSPTWPNNNPNSNTNERALMGMVAVGGWFGLETTQQLRNRQIKAFRQSL